MSRMFRVALTQGISSALPILMWFIISIVYGNRDYVNVFSVTYPMQFLWAILTCSLVSGCIVHERKNGLKSKDYSGSAIIVSSIMLLEVVVFPVYICSPGCQS